MSDSMGSTPAPPLKKKGPNTLMIAVVAIVVVVALIAVVFMGGLLASNEPTDALEKIKKRGTLIVGTNVPWPPFEDLNATSGKYEGIDIEIAQKIADKIGVKLEVKSMAFESLIAAVQTGQIDMAMSSITITEERAQSVNFSNSYYDADQAMLVKIGSSINSVENTTGKKVGAQLGTTGDFWALDNLVATGLVSSYTNSTSIFNMVESLRNPTLDGVVLDTPVANGYVNAFPTELKIGYVIQTGEQYGVAINKEHGGALQAEINSLIADMKADGSLQTIVEKWT